MLLYNTVVAPHKERADPETRVITPSTVVTAAIVGNNILRMVAFLEEGVGLGGEGLYQIQY